MEAQIESFIEYCHKVKGTSRNTELSYRRDLYQLAGFLREEKGLDTPVAQGGIR